MMTCQQLVELLIDFVSGELSQEHQALVERHLRICPPCVHYVETYKLTIQLTRQLPRHQPLPEALKERLWKALQEIKAREGGCGPTA